MELSREEFLTRIQGRLGEDSSDEALSFMEDMTDTFDGLTSKINTDATDWKAKYEENDAQWRTKYKERFFGGNETMPADALDNQEEDVSDDSSPKTFDELFSEREG